jgi:osmotically-inducible protein OsmY
MSGGGMYGGTGYGTAGRTGSQYSGSQSQYGSRGSGAYGQSGAGQGRTGSRGRGTAQQGQGQQGAGTNKDQQPWFEPRIEVGFAVAAPAPTAVQSDIVKPLRAPTLAPRFGKINVSVQGSTVVLRGTVNSEEDRALAAQMAMLEPSVAAVQNELQIAAPVANPPR